MARYNFIKLKEYVSQILLHNGVRNDQSRIISDCLVTADACGVYSHGISILEAHIDRINRGGYNLKMEPELIKSLTSITIVDANNSIGFCSAYKCMNIANEKARSNGIHIVLSKNSNTYGAAFYYVKMAVDQNLIGISFSNSPAAMPVHGGAEKLLGTNPLAIGIPAFTKFPILYDIATSVVAKSKINEARKKGETIPKGWALDMNGLETTDPVEAIKGMVLPMAGAKGAGLAMMIDILAGVLSGAGYMDQVNKFYSEDNSAMNVGQVFISINPQMLMGDSFYNVIDSYIDKIHKSKLLIDNAIRLPGERKMQLLKKSLIEGVELTDHSIHSLMKIGREIGIEDKLILKSS